MHFRRQLEFAGLSPVVGRPSAGAAGTRTRGFKVHGARSDSYKVNIASIVNISNISNISNYVRTT